MMEPMEQLDAVLPTLRGLVASVRPEQLTDPTPCSKWTVRDLINHFATGGHMFAAAFRGEPMGNPDGPVPDILGDDPLGAFDAAVGDFSDAVRSPGALDHEIALPFATLPADATLRLAACDLLVHSWDLARATNQKLEVPGDLVAEANGFIHFFLQPPMRDGDTFADEKPVHDDATPIERLVAFAGRDV